MQTVRGSKPARSSKVRTALVIGLMALMVLGGIWLVLTFSKRSNKDDTPWWIVPRGDGTFKAIKNASMETFQPQTGLDQTGNESSQQVLYVRNRMSLVEQSLAGYSFFERGECDDSQCRTVDLTNKEDAFWFLRQFHQEVSEASSKTLEEVPGVKLLFDIASVVNLDPLTIRVRANKEADENEYTDMLLGYGQGHLPLTTGYQWLLYLRKHEGKPLPRPAANHNYAIGA